MSDGSWRGFCNCKDMSDWIRKQIRINEMKEILAQMVKINKIEGLDAFLNYLGHVNMLRLDINQNANYTNGENQNLIYNKREQLPLTRESRQKILKELKAIVNRS